jgi:hypothetical protein
MEVEGMFVRQGKEKKNSSASLHTPILALQEFKARNEI